MVTITMQHTATHCKTLQHTATYCNALQQAKRRSSNATATITLQHLCNSLQHTATGEETLLKNHDDDQRRLQLSLLMRMGEKDVLEALVIPPKSVSYVCKRAPCFRPIYLQKRPICMLMPMGEKDFLEALVIPPKSSIYPQKSRILFSPNISAKEPYIYVKEPHISTQ